MNHALLYVTLVCFIGTSSIEQAQRRPVSAQKPAPTPTNLEPGRASGQLVINGKATQLNYVYAWLEYDFFDEKKNKTTLFFTEKPVPEESLGADSFDGIRQMLQAGNRYVAEYSIIEGIVGSIRVWETGEPLGQPSSKPVGENKIDLLKSDTRIVQGRLYTEKPFEFFDRTSEFNVAFHALVKADHFKAPVTAKNGTPLPAGGGAPGKAFLEMQKAFAEAKTAREMVRVAQKTYAARLVKEMEFNPDAGPIDKETAQLAFELLRVGVIEAPRVTGGFVTADKATIAVVGLQRPPGSHTSAKSEKVKALFNMHLENGQWKRGHGGIGLDK